MATVTFNRQTGDESRYAERPVPEDEAPALITLFIRLFPTVLAATVAVFSILLHHPLLAAVILLTGLGFSLFLTLSTASGSSAVESYAFDDCGWVKARGKQEFAAVALHRAARRAPANDDRSGPIRKKKPTFFD